MIKTRYILPGRVFITILGLILFSFSILIAFSGGPPNGNTGAPNETTCGQGGCHDNTPNTGGGSITISENFDEGKYQQDKVYTITITVAQSGQRRWGFQAVVKRNDNQNQAGTIIVTDNTNTQVSAGYIKHTATGTRNGQFNSASWSFDWRAPMSDVGITIYAAGNAANGNNFNTGDFIYTTSLAVEAAPPTSVHDDNFAPNRFRLHNSYPNPFNPSTTILYELEKTGRVTLRIYDVMGREVRTLVDMQQSSGAYSVKWDGRDNNGRQAATGTYIVHMKSGRQSDTIKMVLIR